MINGRRALPVQLLEDGDLIRFPWGSVYRVAIDLHHEVVRPRTEHVGRLCSLCHGEITPETTILVCPSCGVVMHLEGEDVPMTARLAFALIPSACPCCSLPIPGDVLEGPEHAPAS